MIYRLQNLPPYTLCERPQDTAAPHRVASCACMHAGVSKSETSAAYSMSSIACLENLYSQLVDSETYLAYSDI